MKIDSYKGGSLQKVLELEKNLNIVLPNDYKDFLTNENGALIENGYFYVKDLNQYLDMLNFFGISIQKGFADIEEINNEYFDDIPNESILIGSDLGSGFILLINDGENNGIWYYDHTYFFEQSSDEENTYFICKTFTEFVAMLENTKPPTDE